MLSIRQSALDEIVTDFSRAQRGRCPFAKHALSDDINIVWVRFINNLQRRLVVFRSCP
jgi:hypothetical protein